MRFAVAVSAVMLTGALTGLGLASPALAVESSDTSPTQAASCSTRNINDKTAEGFCNGGNWRVGVQCTVGKRHYYSGWSNRADKQRAACPRGAGKMTHYWIDQ
jgi:hypothetical protein